MVERGGGGVLVCTSSVSTIHGAPPRPGLRGEQGRTVGDDPGCAVELARYRINAHSVVAGWTQTPLASWELDNPVFERSVMKRMPHRRWGEPGDFSRLAVYLAGGIGGFHAGDEIVVDGGYTVFGTGVAMVASMSISSSAISCASRISSVSFLVSST